MSIKFWVHMPQWLCLILFTTCRWGTARVSNNLQSPPCSADFLLLYVLFVIKENCKFFQVTKSVEQICLFHSAAQVLLSPNSFRLDAVTHHMKSHAVWGRWSDTELWWEVIDAAGPFLPVFSAAPVCTCNKHLWHLSPQYLFFRCWMPGNNLSKICLQSWAVFHRHLSSCMCYALHVFGD